MGISYGSLRTIMATPDTYISNNPYEVSSFIVHYGEGDAENIAVCLRVPTKEDVRIMLLATDKDDRELGLQAASHMARKTNPREAVMTSIRSLFDTPEWVSVAYEANDTLIAKVERDSGAWLRSSSELVSSLLSLAMVTPPSIRQSQYVPSLPMLMVNAAEEVLKAARCGNRCSLDCAVAEARSWMTATGEQTESGANITLCIDEMHEVALEWNGTPFGAEEIENTTLAADQPPEQVDEDDDEQDEDDDDGWAWWSDDEDDDDEIDVRFAAEQTDEEEVDFEAAREEYAASMEDEEEQHCNAAYATQRRERAQSVLKAILDFRRLRCEAAQRAKDFPEYRIA